jgi:hypothetical protein
MQEVRVRKEIDDAFERVCPAFILWVVCSGGQRDGGGERTCPPLKAASAPSSYISNSFPAMMLAILFEDMVVNRKGAHPRERGNKSILLFAGEWPINGFRRHVLIR